MTSALSPSADGSKLDIHVNGAPKIKIPATKVYDEIATLRELGFKILHASDNSNVAAIDIKDIFTADYDEYHIELYDILARVNQGTFFMRASSDNGATWKTTGYTRSQIVASGNTAYAGSAAGEAGVQVTNNVSSTYEGTITFKLKTSVRNNANGLSAVTWAGGTFEGSTAIASATSGFSGWGFGTGIPTNAVRFYMHNGNIDAKVRVYGMRKVV
jgi:hypothetical protein